MRWKAGEGIASFFGKVSPKTGKRQARRVIRE